MSQYHTAHLVYGYDLGSDEAPEVQEKDENGYADVAWIKRDGEGCLDEDFADAISRRLYEKIPGHVEDSSDRFDQVRAIREHYGVEVIDHGWPYDGQASYALVASDLSVDGGESRPINPQGLMSLVVDDGLDQKLDHALAALEGLTPTKPRAWTLLATR